MPDRLSSWAWMCGRAGVRVARRPPDDFRAPSVTGTDREHPPAPLRGPCRAKVTCSAGWLCSAAGLGRDPTACHGLPGVGRAHRRLDEGNPSLFVGGRNQGLDSRTISSGLCTPPPRSPPLPLRCCNAAQSELWPATSGWSASGRSLVKRAAAAACPSAWTSSSDGRVLLSAQPAVSAPHMHRPRTHKTGQKVNSEAGPGPDETRPDRPKTCTRWLLQGGAASEASRDRPCPSSSSSNSSSHSSLPTTYLHTLAYLGTYQRYRRRQHHTCTVVRACRAGSWSCQARLDSRSWCRPRAAWCDGLHPTTASMFGLWMADIPALTLRRSPLRNRAGALDTVMALFRF